MSNLSSTEILRKPHLPESRVYVGERSAVLASRSSHGFSDLSADENLPMKIDFSTSIARASASAMTD